MLNMIVIYFNNNNNSDIFLKLQTYSSALEEDLGKAQAHMDLLLNGEGTLSSKQNEILQAAAKQVTPLHVFML